MNIYWVINTSSSSESEQSGDDDDDGNEYYQIENQAQDVEQLPIYPIDNHIVQLYEDDEADGWKVEQNDVNLWSCGPFLGYPSTIVDIVPPPKPETFFNALFDERMWSVISEATNSYASSKSRDMKMVSEL